MPSSPPAPGYSWSILPICRSPSSRKAFGPLRRITVVDGGAAQRPSEANTRLAPAGDVGALALCVASVRRVSLRQAVTGKPPDRPPQECLGAYKTKTRHDEGNKASQRREGDECVRRYTTIVPIREAREPTCTVGSRVQQPAVVRHERSPRRWEMAHLFSEASEPCASGPVVVSLDRRWVVVQLNYTASPATSDREAG